MEDNPLLKGGGTDKIKNRDELRPPTQTEWPYELPKTWEWARFAQVAAIQSNLVNPRDFPDMPHISPDNIETGTGKLLPNCTRRLTESPIQAPLDHRYIFVLLPIHS